MRSADKEAALDQFDAAVEKLLDAFGSFDQGELTVGYTLIVNGVRYMSPEYDEDYDTDDEDEMVSRYCAFTKRGQQPSLTRGMVVAAASPLTPPAQLVAARF